MGIYPTIYIYALLYAKHWYLERMRQIERVLKRQSLMVCVDGNVKNTRWVGKEAGKLPTNSSYIDLTLVSATLRRDVLKNIHFALDMCTQIGMSRRRNERKDSMLKNEYSI